MTWVEEAKISCVDTKCKVILVLSARSISTFERHRVMMQFDMSQMVRLASKMLRSFHKFFTQHISLVFYSNANLL